MGVFRESTDAIENVELPVGDDRKSSKIIIGNDYTMEDYALAA
jgi:hypothetical protein